MANELQGVKVAFLVANEGIEQAELTGPWEALTGAGAEAVLIAPEPGKAQAFNHLDKADEFTVDRTTGDVSPGDFDALVLPGGVANADFLRTDSAAVKFAKEIFDSGKPVGVICHGAWALVEAGVLEGRTLTSWPSLQTDVRNAGGTWVDREVQVCTAGPNTLVSSRKPDDIPAFNRELLTAFGSARKG